MRELVKKFKRAWAQSKTANLAIEFEQLLFLVATLKKSAAANQLLGWYRKKRSAQKLLSTISWRVVVPAAVVIFVLLAYPLLPRIIYSAEQSLGQGNSNDSELRALDEFETQLETLVTADSSARLPIAEQRTDIDLSAKITINKIGVDTQIIESTNAHAALNQGVWRIPFTSTPDRGGNTVLTAHRYKFLPPSNKTFYLLDKLVVGDTFSIRWAGKKFIYKISSQMVVEPDEVSVLVNSEKPIVTLVTCTLLFTSTQRLVVV